MGTDFGKMERLPRKMTPELILWLRDHAVVSKTIETPYGTVEVCENYVIEASEEELAERRRRVQMVAARIRDAHLVADADATEG